MKTTPASQTSYFYMDRFSNTTTYSEAAFGFNWLEAKPNYETSLYGGVPAGWTVNYNDPSLLVVSGVHGNSYEDMVFWANEPYFAFEGGWSGSSTQVEQFQIGVTSPSSGTYYIANIYPDSPYYTSGAFGSSSVWGDVQVTDQLQAACGCFTWMANYMSGTVNPALGFVMNYNSLPWRDVSNGYGDSGDEMQFSEWTSDANAGPYTYAPPTALQFQFSGVIYPFMSNATTNKWFGPVQKLAQSMYQSSITNTESWAPLDFAQSDGTQTSKYDISNAVGFYYVNGYENFFLNNRSSWGVMSNSGITPAMMYLSAYGGPFTNSSMNNNFKPAAALQNTTGIYQAGFTSYSSNSVSADATNGYSTTNSKVTLNITGTNKDLALEGNFLTAGTSDKINVTLSVHVDKATTAKRIWMSFVPVTVGSKTPTCTQVAAGHILDCTSSDYQSSLPAGMLIDYISGNISAFATSGSTMASNRGTIYFYNSSSYSSIPEGTYQAKFELWFHYGTITSPSQITTFYSAPTLKPETNYWSYNPSNFVGTQLRGNNTHLYIPYEIANVSATMPQMTFVHGREYNLTNVGHPSETESYTVYLNKTIFANLATVTGVTTWSYTPSTGALTYTEAMPSNGRNFVVITGTPYHVPSFELTTLLNVYNSRPDLQAAYPEVGTGTYANLVNWAYGVTTQQWVDSNYDTLAPCAYWYTLMYTYNTRPDLQADFPNAFTSQSHYQNLINWAGGVATKQWVDSSYSSLNDSGYWYTLMNTYNGRPDLLAAYPNVYSNSLTSDYQKLITWAGGVVTQKWTDSSYASLSHYGYWYDLLMTYNQRLDLQAAYPSAYSSMASYQNLVNWAGGVVTQQYTDSSYSQLNTYGYWYDLMNTYNNRPDLQAAYPNAYTSQPQYQTLINWANGVVTHAWTDTSVTNLSYYASYYEAHHT